MSTSYLFTYGLLRKQAQHNMSQFMSSKAEFICEATFQGKLYMVDYYPGAIPSDDINDLVVGDVFSVNDAAILQELDAFEGVGSSFSKPNEYRRVIKSVRTKRGEHMKAWIYLYNWLVDQENQIKNGDFLNPDWTR